MASTILKFAVSAGLLACHVHCQAAPGAPASEVLYQAENLLLAQRANPDLAGFQRAKALVAETVSKSPEDARARTDLAWVLMTEHRFLEAYEATKIADLKAGAEVRNLALMCDALTELGRYEEAVSTAQRLVDLRPGVPAWIRVARMRFLHGDLEGAIDLLRQATSGDSGRGEASAWVWLELARYEMEAGAFEAAGRSIGAARAAFPGFAAILPMEARLRSAQGDAHGALTLYLRAVAERPSAEVALEAWRLAVKHGMPGVAKHQAALLEGLAKLPGARQSRRALAEYFTESGQTGKALQWANEELTQRPDIYSHATVAKAMAAAGRLDEAKREAAAAVILNTRDRQLQADMGAILGGDTGRVQGEP